MRININVAEMRRAIKYVMAGLSGMGIGTYVKLGGNDTITFSRFGQDEEKTTVDKVSIELEIMRPKDVGHTLELAQLEAFRQVHAEAFDLIFKARERLAPVGIIGITFANGCINLIRDDGAIQPHDPEGFAAMAAALAISMPEPIK